MRYRRLVEGKGTRIRIRYRSGGVTNQARFLRLRKKMPRGRSRRIRLVK